MNSVEPTWPFSVGDEATSSSRPDRISDAAPLPFYRFHEIQASLEASDFVEGVLTSEGMSVLYGESNSGKTFLALDLALHIASGTPWFGREITAGPVLYLALEGGNGIKNRIVAYQDHHKLIGSALQFFLVKQSLNLLDPSGDIAAITATATQIEAECGAAPVLIVIDTLSRAMAGGNENAPEDMTALVAAGDALRKHTGAHCMWIHHSGKDQARGARGHSSLRAATDTEIEVIAEGSDRRAEVRKQRDLVGGDIFRFSLSVMELGTNGRGKVVTSCVVAPEREGSAERPDRAKSLTGHNKRAYEVLSNTLVEDGQAGHAGVPDKLLSVSETRWREQFYECAMPGAEQQAKRRAFQRAGEKLVDLKLVAMNAGRVWITSHHQPGQYSGT